VAAIKRLARGSLPVLHVAQPRSAHMTRSLHPARCTGDKAEPVVVAVPVGPASEPAASEGASSSSGSGAEVMSWPVPGESHPHQRPPGCVACTRSHAAHVRGAGYEDPIIAGKQANGEISWPGQGSKADKTFNAHPTPPVPATMPSGMCDASVSHVNRPCDEGAAWHREGQVSGAAAARRCRHAPVARLLAIGHEGAGDR